MNIQWNWWQHEPIKAEMTQITANFINKLIDKGIDLSSRRDYYLWFDEGQMIPALNVSGSKLVKYFIDQAVKRGLIYKFSTMLEKIVEEDGLYKLSTNKGDFLAKKVLLAVGPNINKFLPKAKVGFEKRVLNVLDTPITKERLNFPHVILPWKDGWVFLFLKKIGDETKLIFGQEDIIEYSSKWEEENYFNKFKKDLTQLMPFLKNAKVEKVLWGFDATNKTLKIYEEGNLIAANCGSAVRSCVYIGQKVAEKLLEK